MRIPDAREKVMSCAAHGRPAVEPGEHPPGVKDWQGVRVRETGISLPDNQRQQPTSHAPKDVLPLGMCAYYCALCQPLLRAFSG